jgi:hypothetical protein
MQMLTPVSLVKWHVQGIFLSENAAVSGVKKVLSIEVIKAFFRGKI